MIGIAYDYFVLCTQLVLDAELEYDSESWGLTEVYARVYAATPPWLLSLLSTVLYMYFGMCSFASSVSGLK